MGKLSQESSEWIGLRWLGQFYHDYSRSVRNHCNWRKPVRVQIVPGAAASRERLGLRQGEDDRCEEDGREPGKKTGASRFRLISLQGKSLSSLLFFTEGFHSPSSFLLGIEVCLTADNLYPTSIARNSGVWLATFGELTNIITNFFKAASSTLSLRIDCGLAIARNLAYEAFVAAPAAGVCR
ncbi:hypothetical protein MLD38_006494 [Melastoma candidum]|uniref:Uncharacterized protein n=1 Tax=Melastoma candidum TaxID=119954 RepID=A0ACB9RPB5_9MYRT|nr:hypothetical protein MLD38_006494 [Melastoma candidum]